MAKTTSPEVSLELANARKASDRHTLVGVLALLDEVSGRLAGLRDEETSQHLENAQTKLTGLYGEIEIVKNTLPKMRQDADWPQPYSLPPTHTEIQQS